jgi:transcription initiation factor IIE alpha subunit
MSLSRRVLKLLEDAEDLTQDEIRKALEVESSALAGTLQYLEDSGQIKSKQVPKRQKWGPRNVKAFSSPQREGIASPLTEVHLARP